jgi:putative phosphoribosyl transferase
MVFRDRAEAGEKLGRELLALGLNEPVLLALPRGGVAVAAEAAASLGLPFEVFVALKVGAPHHQELAVGAIAEGLDEPILSEAAAQVGVDQAQLQVLAERSLAEEQRRVRLYRSGRALPELTGNEVVVIDDGLATGVTAEAALRAIAAQHPSRLVLAAPVCAPETAARLRGLADDVVCLETPGDFRAVGLWYLDFSPTSDEEVLDLLARHHPPGPQTLQG